ncbi:unnamed protein product [Peronospora belbahrii]|uniref:polyribonucleotide nucleotidyltransferase n=1 Tax=Peronospora belbahrii TaxID=622444 RepID=A0AAU9KTG4_9STRA|nr:unnamed protein product [Peronospora belbahrii]
MMLSIAARRLPVAAVIRHSAINSTHYYRLPRVAGSAHQSRAFLGGLRDFLFGPKKPSAEEEKAAKVLQMQESLESTQHHTQEIDESKEEKIQVVGSLDSTTYSVGKLAKLADGAVLASCGRTVLLTTVVSGNHNGNPLSNTSSFQRDFLPLSVDFRVKSHAVGLIPDNQKRREYIGGDEEVLQSRVVDRAIRPLFPRDYCEDTQLLATVQSYDPNNDPLVVAINSASAALSVSGIPWNGPVGCVRVVEVDGQLVVNPTALQRDAATLDVLYAGTAERVIMVEVSGDEANELRVDEALDLAQANVLPAIEEQKKLVREHGKPKRVFSPLFVAPEVWTKAQELGRKDAEAIIARGRIGKQDRQQGEREVYSKMLNGMRQHFAGASPPVDDAAIQRAVHDTFQRMLRERILTVAKERKGPKNKPVRFDGRPVRIVRPLEMETGALPMAHGSSLFARGETQTLCSVTLGPLERGLRLRGALHEAREQAEPNAPTPLKNAMLHYEFPPFCVNEMGRVGGTNRRMIGHGALAEKAVLPILPSITEFPYTIRMTSEVVGSDGSSSMATVCGVSLALMDAGVPVRRAVAGSEDHYGDMDLKVAGTTSGVTAIQLDVKLSSGVPLHVLKEGLREAKQARLHILRRMATELAEPRKTLKSSGSSLPNVSIECVIATNLIGALIGVGGSNIRDLESRFNVSVSIVDRREGIVRVVGSAEDVDKAREWLRTELTDVAKAGPRGNSNNDSSSSRDNDHGSNKGWSHFFRKGERYTMRVTQIMDFGAILQSPTGQRGFVHISELSRDKISNIQDVVSEGQEMEFECLQDGASGKMSRRVLLNSDGIKDASTTFTSSETLVSQHHSPRSSTSSRRPKTTRLSK